MRNLREGITHRLALLALAGSLGVGAARTGLAAPVETDEQPKSSAFLEKFPELKSFLFTEPESSFRFGAGLAPVRILKSSVGYGINVFQVHWMKRWLDWEVFSATYGASLTGEAFSKASSFTFRSIPKIRLSDSFSIGPVLGYEFISFGDVEATIVSTELSPQRTTRPEPFSSRGWIMGAAASQIFPVSKRYSIRLSQIAYRQSYETRSPYEGWVFNYVGAAGGLNQDRTPIEPGLVVLLEISLLF